MSVTAAKKKDWDLEALGRFLQAVLDWEEQRESIEARGGEHALDDVVRGGSLAGVRGDLHLGWDPVGAGSQP